MKLYPSTPPQIPRSKDDLVQEMVQMIERVPLTSDQIRTLYQAVTNRMINKTCQSCGKVTLEIEGALVWVDGDMSKPKQFLCRICKDK